MIRVVWFLVMISAAKVCAAKSGSGTVPECLTCNSRGYIVVDNHACGGNERLCVSTCPIQERAQCPDCQDE